MGGDEPCITGPGLHSAMRNSGSRLIRSTGATTLIELLVSVAVTLSIMVLLAMIVSSVSRQWTGGSSRFLLDAEASVALDYLVEDLRSMVRKGDGSEWFKIRKSSAGGANQDFLILLLAQPLDGEGKVATIAYRLGFHDPMGGSEERPVMYRCVFPAEETIEHLGAAELEVAWNDRLEEVVDDDWFLAENVVEVSFTFHLRDADGKSVTVECLNEASGGKSVVVDGAPLTVAGTTLERATVSLLLLDEMGLRVLEQESMSLPEIIARYGREYVEEVSFPGTIGEIKYDI